MPELATKTEITNIAEAREISSSRLPCALRLGVSTVALVGVAAFGTQPAQAETIGNTLGQGLTLRAQPNTSSANLSNIPEGAHVDPGCHIEGESIIGDNIWHRVTHDGKQGYITDAYLYGDTPEQTRYYPTSEELVADGIPRCDNLNSQPTQPQQDLPEQPKNSQPTPQPQKPQQEEQKLQEKHLPCTPLLFIGARGSGTPYGEDGLGDQIRPLANNLKSFYGDNITVHGLPYEAVSIIPFNNRVNGEYAESVELGRQILKNIIKIQDRNCSDQKFILAGHSQGADLVNDYVSFNESTNDKIVAVTTFGDPDFNPSSPRARGDFVPILGGIWSRRGELPEDVAPKSESYCLLVDPVCNFSVENLVWEAIGLGSHSLYNKLPTSNAESFIKSRINYNGW